MPQLDLVTCVSQIFWLIVSFTFLYAISFKNIVPFLARILKVRSKKVVKSGRNISSFKLESENIRGTYDSIIAKAAKELHTLQEKFHLKLNGWSTASIKNATGKKELKSNGAYLKGIKYLHEQTFLVKKLA